MSIFQRLSTSGLSPLARGTLGKLYRRKWRGRFIPAGAGNTLFAGDFMKLEAVYPRWRGEHRNPRNKKARFNGLSPLARGTPQNTQKRHSKGRFIPAGAGNT